MILHYFKKKEKNEKKIALELYESILRKSKKVINNSSLSIKKNYNSSFELVSFFIIIHLKKNLLIKKENYKKINDELVAIFITDLDDSLRNKGIGDMSIGKYVKKYVKKFYFRLSKFPTENIIKNDDCFVEYLKLFDLIEGDNLFNASKVLFHHYNEIHS